jgi:hypothetical protein
VIEPLLSSTKSPPHFPSAASYAILQYLSFEQKICGAEDKL